jgi:hypothetical protein
LVPGPSKEIPKKTTQAEPRDSQLKGHPGCLNYSDGCVEDVQPRSRPGLSEPEAAKGVFAGTGVGRKLAMNELEMDWRSTVII